MRADVVLLKGNLSHETYHALRISGLASPPGLPTEIMLRMSDFDYRNTMDDDHPKVHALLNRFAELFNQGRIDVNA